MTRLAVLSDIHGNSIALEAVLADAAGRKVDAIVNLGDCVSGPLWPAETLAILRRECWPTVRGNHDRQVAEEPVTALGASDVYAHERLTADHRSWLGGLPSMLRLAHGIAAFHACPADDATYLIERQVGAALQRAAAEDIAARLGTIDAAIILTGHSHQAAVLRLPDGRWIVNPGSVGCPAYDDDATSPPHVSEAGCPSARYAILDFTANVPVFELLSIPYPHEVAARQAEAAGRPDWAYALRTGFMRGAQA